MENEERGLSIIFVRRKVDGNWGWEDSLEREVGSEKNGEEMKMRIIFGNFGFSLNLDLIWRIWLKI